MNDPSVEGNFNEMMNNAKELFHFMTQNSCRSKYQTCIFIYFISNLIHFKLMCTFSQVRRCSQKYKLKGMRYKKIGLNEMYVHSHS